MRSRPPSLPQPMSFEHYPFDSFDLLIELRFFGELGQC